MKKFLIPLFLVLAALCFVSAVFALPAVQFQLIANSETIDWGDFRLLYTVPDLTDTAFRLSEFDSFTLAPVHTDANRMQTTYTLIIEVPTVGYIIIGGNQPNWVFQVSPNDLSQATPDAAVWSYSESPVVPIPSSALLLGTGLLGLAGLRRKFGS